MTLTDFIFETLKEVVSEYDGKQSYRAGSNKVSSNNSGNYTNGRKYPYAKKESVGVSSNSKKKRLISEQFVKEELAAGREVVICEGDIITPSARDILNRKR